MTLLTSARSESSAHNGAHEARKDVRLSGFQIASGSKPTAPCPSDEELSDICTTRGLLEEQAARLAARNITSKDVSALERIVKAWESAVAAHRTEEIVRLQRELHFTIYRASKRQHLVQLIDSLWDLSARYTSPSSQRVSDEWSGERHVIRSIVSACKLKDAHALALMIRYKVNRDSARLREPIGDVEGSAPESAVSGRTATPRDAKGRRSRRS